MRDLLLPREEDGSARPAEAMVSTRRRAEVLAKAVAARAASEALLTSFLVSFMAIFFMLYICLLACLPPKLFDWFGVVVVHSFRWLCCW